MKTIKEIDLSEPATFYESRLAPGMSFACLSQALRHAVNVPLARKHHTARIETHSGTQYGWDEISILHDHLRATGKD